VFAKDDSRFFSVGQEDCCLLQWKVIQGGGVPINEACSEDLLVGTSEIDLKDTKEFERFDDANASNIDDKTKVFFMEVLLICIHCLWRTNDFSLFCHFSFLLNIYQQSTQITPIQHTMICMCVCHI
jgi:hypothetical protein